MNTRKVCATISQVLLLTSLIVSCGTWDDINGDGKDDNKSSYKKSIESEKSAEAKAEQQIDKDLVGTWIAEMEGVFKFSQAYSADGRVQDRIEVEGQLVADVVSQIEPDGEKKRGVLTVKEILTNRDDTVDAAVGDKLYCIYEIDKALTPDTLRSSCGENEYPTSYSDEDLVLERR